MVGIKVEILFIMRVVAFVFSITIIYTQNGYHQFIYIGSNYKNTKHIETSDMKGNKKKSLYNETIWKCT